MICDYESAWPALPLGRTTVWKPPPVVIVSHVSREGDIRRALAAGVQGYLLLDSTAQEIVDAVIEVCNGSHYITPRVAKRVVDGILGSSLTNRELEVVGFVSEGASNKVIALHLNISVGTVKAHMRSVLDKLGAANRMEAAAIAARRGLVPGPTFTTSMRDWPATSMRVS